MNTYEFVRPLQDEMVNKLILESLLTNGKVTIEEASFMNNLLENILAQVFADEIKQIEESIQNQNQPQNYQIEETTNSVNETELNEKSMIKLFLKK